MGRKKFNKKDAAVYHLVRRSQRDVGGYFDDKGQPIDMPSDFVLIPSSETLKRAELNQKKHVLAEADADADVGHDNRDNQNNQEEEKDAFLRAKKKLALANLVDDYDYDQHMKPISGTGTFIQSNLSNPNNPNNSNKSNNSNNINYYSHEIRSKQLNLIDPMINEIDINSQLDSIALTSQCMDEEIAHALFDDFEEDEFEEILDDFCITANQLTPIHEMTNDNNHDTTTTNNNNNNSGGFDFDAHIEKLIAKAKLEENGGSKIIPNNHEAWTQQQSMFKGMKPRKSKKQYNDNDYDLDSIDEEGDDEDDDDEDSFDHDYYHPDYFTAQENPGIVPKLNPEEEKALCEKFEQTLLEYDSDEVGDLDAHCYNIKGDRPLEGDIQIEAALDSFLQHKKDENFVMGTNSIGMDKRVGGSSHVYMNKKLVPYNAWIDQVGGKGKMRADCDEDEEEEEEEQKLEDVLAEADEVLANPEMDLPPEEVLIDGKSYFTMKERNPWDCESILSTYSNLDNNPMVVGRSGRRRNKKKGNRQGGGGIDDESTIAEEQPAVQILLSNKTGLPLGVLPGPKGLSSNNNDDREQNETFVSVNKGEARKKGESAEEKKTRKLLVKQERQVARIQKKMMREAIQEEFGQRVHKNVANDVGGKSVFKY